MFNIKDVKRKIELDIKIYKNNLPELPKEIYGFDNILNINRNKIDKINPDIWKKVRWYINDYDFLVKDPIINRAFYKYWEIINEFSIFDKYTENDIIYHCSEAPGGFIQGSNIFLQINNTPVNTKIPESLNIDEDGFTTVLKKKKEKKKYKIYTISLNKDLPKYKNYNLPSYNKKILNKNVFVTYGKDNNGDINNLENINYIKNMIDDKYYLITADGGFDEGTDFNNKEQLHYYLILNEIITCLSLQKLGGRFILKMFDIFTDTSIHLLYLLNNVYEDIYIYKPKTSRPSNSERYIICKSFLGIENNIIEELKSLSDKLKLCICKYPSFTLFNIIPNSFIELIKTVNNQLLNNQCKYLEKAIILCNDKNFIINYESELENSLQKRKNIFKKWEKHYFLNNFLPSS